MKTSTVTTAENTAAGPVELDIFEDWLSQKKCMGGMLGVTCKRLGSVSGILFGDEGGSR